MLVYVMKKNNVLLRPIFSWSINYSREKNKMNSFCCRTCLRQEGKVILPLSEGDPTTSRVISLHRLQTLAQATTFRRCGHCSPVTSTRLMISARSSGSMVDQSVPSSDSLPMVSLLVALRAWTLLKYLKNLRDRKSFIKTCIIMVLLLRAQERAITAE